MPMATSSSVLAAATSSTAAASAPAPSAASSTFSGGGSGSLIGTSAAQFREIHKNTWLKRLNAEGKKITVGPKKSDRSWVVFCVHDDTDALLEGYAEPRQAPSHYPEWTVSLQDTLHISHALIPNSHEFEFVVTLANEVIRFHAMSWEIMQEWVETLRSKLREMKILSPRENLYTKLPEIRAPLLPTRDPTSPLPAPPPVPAALVPGVERVVPPSLAAQENNMHETMGRSEVSHSASVTTTAAAATTATLSVTTTVAATVSSTTTTTTVTTSRSRSSSMDRANVLNSVISGTTITNSGTNSMPIASATSATSTITPIMANNLPALASMSNTLTQNLLNMLSDPISAYSEQINDASHLEEADESASSLGDANDIIIDGGFDDEELLSPILRKAKHKQESTITTTTNVDNSVRVDIGQQRASADQIKNWNMLVENDCMATARLHTSRSLSAGAAESSRKHMPTPNTNNVLASDANNVNITALEISTDAQSGRTWQNTSKSSTNSDAMEQQLDLDKMNITIIEVSTNDSNEQENEMQPNRKSSSNKRVTGEIFKFPETKHQETQQLQQQPEYKSNVQIIPSTKANSSTIQVLGTKTNNTTTTATTTQYATPLKRSINKNIAAVTTTTNTTTTQATTTANLAAEKLKITTVHVKGSAAATSATTTVTAAATATAAASLTTSGNSALHSASGSSISLYGTCYATPLSSNPSTTTATTNVSPNNGTPKMLKKIILSANSSGITNIAVNNTTPSRSELQSANLGDASTTAAAATTTVKHNVGSVHYEKVFLSTSAPSATSHDGTASKLKHAPPSTSSPTPIAKRSIEASYSSSASKSTNTCTSKPSSPIPPTDARTQIEVTAATTLAVSPATTTNVDMPSLPIKNKHKPKQSPLMSRAHPSTASPVANRRRIPIQASTSSSPPALQTAQQTPKATSTAQPFPLPSRAHLLTRGLTEAVITTRPSRRDFHLMKTVNAGKGKQPTTTTNSSTKNTTAPQSHHSSNNNGDNNGVAQASSSQHAPTNHSSRSNRNCDLLEQRRRSSSTSDARTVGAVRGANNNELPGGRNVALRFQQPPQPFRNVMENGHVNGPAGGGSSNAHVLSTSVPPHPSGANSSPANMRMTLREHQIMQLRREIMHPGGVRLQLRRKDCVGSIAWVDTFGAVWVAGWKQKEHPVLYNALHIGDQLLSISGTTVTNANEANKIIRNTNTLFVEVLVRRMPFGRGYAIRREREGQCLGLIRDGNTATIVDVVPNSLAARHGLPPKAQSCDGTTLAFWILTEINGRPLNLYFKDNEIRDRLNSVGRDISILVQPSDFITKLKKQLKSLRGYKDYLVQ